MNCLIFLFCFVVGVFSLSGNWEVDTQPGLFSVCENGAEFNGLANEQYYIVVSESSTDSYTGFWYGVGVYRSGANDKIENRGRVEIQQNGDDLSVYFRIGLTTDVEAESNWMWNYTKTTGTPTAQECFVIDTDKVVEGTYNQSAAASLDTPWIFCLEADNNGERVSKSSYGWSADGLMVDGYAIGICFSNGRICSLDWYEASDDNSYLARGPILVLQGTDTEIHSVWWTGEYINTIDVNTQYGTDQQSANDPNTFFSDTTDECEEYSSVIDAVLNGASSLSGNWEVDGQPGLFSICENGEEFNGLANEQYYIVVSESSTDIYTGFWYGVGVYRSGANGKIENRGRVEIQQNGDDLSVYFRIGLTTDVEAESNWMWNYTKTTGTPTDQECFVIDTDKVVEGTYNQSAAASLDTPWIFCLEADNNGERVSKSSYGWSADGLVVDGYAVGICFSNGRICSLDWYEASDDNSYLARGPILVLQATDEEIASVWWTGEYINTIDVNTQYGTDQQSANDPNTFFSDTTDECEEYSSVIDAVLKAISSGSTSSEPTSSEATKTSDTGAKDTQETKDTDSSSNFVTVSIIMLIVSLFV